MSNTEKILASNSLEIQHRIFEIQDEIKANQVSYLNQANKTKAAFKKLIDEQKIIIRGAKVKKRYLNLEKKLEYQKLKKDYQQKRQLIEEDFKFAVAETKDLAKLHLLKIETIYQKLLKDYKLNHRNQEFKTFQSDYQKYYETERQTTNQKTAETLFELEAKKTNDLNALKLNYETNLNALDLKYHKLDEAKKLKTTLKLASTKKAKKAIRKEIKLCDYVFKNKQINRQIINEARLKLRALKNERNQQLKKEKAQNEALKAQHLEFKALKLVEIKALKQLRQEMISNRRLELNEQTKNGVETFQQKIKAANSSKEAKKFKLELEKFKAEMAALKSEFQNELKYAKQERISRIQKAYDEKEKSVFKNINTAYIYVLPAVISAIFFIVLPFAFMIIASFFKLDLVDLGASRFVGLSNYYSNFVRDTEFQKALYNTLIFSFITVVLLSVVTIGMAAWLAKDTRVHNAAQTMIFTPHIASFVAISILWIALLHPSGIINQILGVFGIKGPGWLVQKNTALISVSFVTVWKDMGYYVLIIISGLQAIPAYVYEAAKLDKASRSTMFFKLTIPLLTPTLSFVFITKFINSFKVFAPIEIMTNGGPLGHSMVLSYWVYKVGRVGFNYGTAMAGAVILTIMIAFFTFLNNRYFRKTIKY